MARNFDELSILTANKGYVSEALRRYAQAHIVKPVFKHRNQSALDHAENQLQDDDIYHQRSAAEAAFRVLKQRFGDRLDSRTWYGQFLW